MEIIVNQKLHDVEGRLWRVEDLKHAVGIKPWLQLSEVKPFGLAQLEDEDVIELDLNSRFVSHARSGAQS